MGRQHGGRDRSVSRSGSDSPRKAKAETAESPSNTLLVSPVKSFLKLGDVVIEQFEVVGNFFFAADRGHQDNDLRAGLARDGTGRLQVKIRLLDGYLYILS